MEKVKLAALLFLLTITAAFSQTRVTTYSVVTDTLRGLNQSNIHLVDTMVFTNGSRIWKAPDFGSTLTAGSVLFGGTSSFVGGVYRQNNSHLFWDSTNTRLGIGVNSSLGAKLHVRGVSAVSGSALLVQNSTPVSLFEIANNGAVNIGSTSITTPVSLYGGLAIYSNSTDVGFATSTGGSGYWGFPTAFSGVPTNYGQKQAPVVTGNGTGAAEIRGVYIAPSMNAGANNQVLTAFVIRPGSYGAGGFTGLTNNVADFQDASGNSLLKISNTLGMTATVPYSSSSTVKASQYIHSVDSTNSATVSMTTQSIQKVFTASSVTTVNFPPGVEGLVITVVNAKAGTITVTAYLDLTGTGSITQAAQSAVSYFYSSGGWRRLN